HHTSDDKIDKTDASEFRRVGAFASAAAWFIATADATAWKKLRTAAYADRVQELARRLAQDATVVRDLPSKGTMRNREEFEDQSEYLESMSKTGDAQARRHNNPQENVPGPRRLTLLPLDASAFEGISAEDAKWLAEQEARFASDSEGLATKPNFPLISFEA